MGRQKCHVHRHKAADGLSSTKTPSKLPPRRHRGAKGANHPSTAEDEADEMERLEKLFKKHEMGEIPRVDWLDNLVFRGVEKRRLHAGRLSKEPRRASGRNKSGGPNAETKVKDDTNSDQNGTTEDDDLVDEDKNDEERFDLYVDLPRFDFQIVFSDHEYPAPPISSQPYYTPGSSNINLKPPPEVQLGPGINGAAKGTSDDYNDHLIKVYDAEVSARDNPAESKHRRLVRSHRTGVLDRDLKPNAKIRDELNGIMLYGPTQELTSEEKDLIWKFRHHLTRDKRALTKFVKSVAWHDQGEARQAVQILPKWTEIDVDDALELLGPTFDNTAVRAYAVDRLRKSDDEELLLYLLQLVQALKFEKISPEAAEDATQDSSLARFLIARATSNMMLGNYLHWYLMVECDDRSPEQGTQHRKLFARVEYDFMTELMKVRSCSMLTRIPRPIYHS